MTEKSEAEFGGNHNKLLRILVMKNLQMRDRMSV